MQTAVGTKIVIATQIFEKNIERIFEDNFNNLIL